MGSKPTMASPLPHLVSVEFLISSEFSLHASDPRGNSDPSTTQRFRKRSSTVVIEYGIVLPDSKSLDLHLPGSTFFFLPHGKANFQEDHVLNSSHQERRARASPNVSIGFFAHLLLGRRSPQS